MKRTVQQKFGKKLLLSLVAIVGLSAYTANAQSPTIYLGVLGGAQYTNINSSGETFTGNVGYNGAVSAEARFSRKFGIELQAGMSTLEAKTTYKDSIQYYSYVMRYFNHYDFSSQWLQGHLLFKYYIRLGGDPIIPYDRPEGSGNYAYLFAGPYMGLMMSNNITKYGRTGTQSTQKHINYTPYDSGAKTSIVLTDNDAQESFDKSVLTNYDIGYTIGGGISLKLSQSASIDFSLRYSSSLTTIDNPSIKAAPESANGFFLGHNTITITGTQDAGITYTPAQAFNEFISFNVGLKFKIFGDSY